MERSTIFDAQRPGMRTISGPLLDLSQTSEDLSFVVIRGIAPTGTVVPLHSHDERETMVIVEGTLSAWLDGSWMSYSRGDVIEVAANAVHALRNDGPDEVALVLVTTPRMARFFGEISASQSETAMTPERIAHFVETTAAYGFWTGSPADQAAVGIELPGAPPTDHS